MCVTQDAMSVQTSFILAGQFFFVGYAFTTTCIHINVSLQTQCQVFASGINDKLILNVSGLNMGEQNVAVNSVALSVSTERLPIT